MSADRRESSSPERVTSKKASSCFSSELNVLRRSEAEIASPAAVSVCERPAIMTDCTENSAKSAPAARVGVLRHRVRVHGGDVEPARLDDVLERVRVDGAGVVRHGGGLRIKGHGDRAHARRPLERGRHRGRA